MTASRTSTRRSDAARSTAPAGAAGSREATPAPRVAVDLTRVEARVASTLRTAGQPLDAATRGAAERHLGADLSRVRIHSDAGAGESARSIAARAYSVGPHVVFAPGRYAPATAAGRALLLHELAHVVQRGPGAPMPGGPLTLGPVDSPHERAAQGAMGHVPADSLSGGPILPAGVVARSAEDDEAKNRAYAAARGLPEPGPGDTATRVKDTLFVAGQPRGTSGLTAYEATTKATAYPGSIRAEAAAMGPGGTIVAPRVVTGYVRSNESTYSQAITAAGAQANSKQVDADKTFYGISFGTKGGTRLHDGTAVDNYDAELAVGQSEKTARAVVTNKAATSETSTFKTFSGSKHTVNGTDARGDFRETEVVAGQESRRSVGAVAYRDKAGQEVARERQARFVSTDGRSEVNLRNTGTKYQALDLTRVEALRGHDGGAGARRAERVVREVEHVDGSRQRDDTSVTNRGTVTTHDGSVRLAGGVERRVNQVSSRGTQTSTRRSEVVRDDGAQGFTGKASADAAYGRRTAVTLSQSVPGALAIAPRVQQGSTVFGGRLGLVTSTAPDPRTVTRGDKRAYEDPANAGQAGGYTESLDVRGTRRQVKDEYEVTDRGASASVSAEKEAGLLHSFLRKDRFNLGWLVVENAISDYYLVGAQGKASAGAKAGADVNNVNAGVSGSVGATRRLSDELTVRLGGFFAKIKAEADAFAGIEAAVSAEGGYTRGAGAGGAAGASAFAGVRAGVGGKLEGGYEGVSFAAGAYKLRGSLGAGFKANIEARYQNGYLLLSGGLALSAEVGVGADVELRINPTAVGAAVLKKAVGLKSIENLGVAETARKAAGAARDTVGGAARRAGAALGRLFR